MSIETVHTGGTCTGFSVPSDSPVLLQDEVAERTYGYIGVPTDGEVFLGFGDRNAVANQGVLVTKQSPRELIPGVSLTGARITAIAASGTQRVSVVFDPYSRSGS